MCMLLAYGPHLGKDERALPGPSSLYSYVDLHLGFTLRLSGVLYNALMSGGVLLPGLSALGCSLGEEVWKLLL